jgi:hypothetical protein
MTQTKARDVVIREDEVKALLRPAGSELGGRVLAALEQPALLSSPPFVAALGQAAHALETWLDDFDARNNRTFVIIGELVASVRGLAAVRGLGLHVSRRLPLYHRLVDGQPLVDDLERAGQTLDRGLLNLLAALHREAGRLGLTWEAVPFDGTEEVLQRQRRLLPRNLDEEETVDERQHIAEIGARFLKVLQTSRSLDLGFARPIEALAEFVATKDTEERCRWYESTVQHPVDVRHLRCTPPWSAATPGCSACAATPRSPCTCWRWRPRWCTSTSGTRTTCATSRPARSSRPWSRRTMSST